MPHQDAVHLAKNQKIIEGLVADLVAKDALERHGNASLPSGWLTAMALLVFGWMDGTLGVRVKDAGAAIGHICKTSTTVTRQGLMKALASCGDDLVNLVVDRLPQLLAGFEGLWTRGGKVNIAVDGTKLAAPRTKDNQAAFSAAMKTEKGTRRKRVHTSPANASKASTVQLLVTMFWHLGSGLPLRWNIEGSSGSERKSVVELLDQLPANARLIGDAEFVGYALWSTIIESKRSFLFRVGSNITLLKRLGGKFRTRDGCVHFWPDWARKTDQPPLVLWLITLHNGRHPVYLVASELEMTETLASELYTGRWGVEVFFRSVKQTWGRSKLVCITSESIIVELNWTLLGIWSAMYLAKRVLDAEGTKPKRMSAVKVMRACQRVIQGIVLDGRRSPLLADLLAEAVIVDESSRPASSKKSRDYPRKKTRKPCGRPNILTATPDQKQAAKKFLT